MAMRNKYFVCQEPGPGTKFYLVEYLIHANGPRISKTFDTKKKWLEEAKTRAKANQPSSVIIQNRDGEISEVVSYPSVPDGDER